jgi:hypothetical protein
MAWLLSCHQIYQNHGGVTQEELDHLREGVENCRRSTEKSRRHVFWRMFGNGKLQRVEEDIRKLKLQGALKQYQAGFPVDINSGSWEVFDMFIQQRKLNNADPEKRKQGTLEEARKARERGFHRPLREICMNLILPMNSKLALKM